MKQFRHRKDSVILQRSLGAPRLFSVGYASIGASFYIALGAVAGFALGLTPLVFLGVGVAFVVSLMVYMEGATLYPERGGSATFARYAFNELWSFVAGWAILLDYLIVIAVAAFAVPHYLHFIFSITTHGLVDSFISVAVIVVVAIANIRGFGAGARKRATQIAVLDMTLQLLIVVIGVVMLFNLDLITRYIDVGTVPTWKNLIYAVAIATLAFTGIESASNLAPEIKANPSELKRVISAGAVAVVLLYLGISIVALMAVPVEHVTGGYQTQLSHAYKSAPMLGVASNLDVGILTDVLKYLVSIVGTLVLFQAANAAMIGVTGLSYSLATNRQLPKALAKLHPTRSTPYVAIAISSLIAIALVFPENLNLLLSIYAFGAFIAMFIANISIVKLRYTQPDRPRPYKIPLNVRIRGGDFPLLAGIAALAAFSTWVSVLILHAGARWVGLGWMVFGLMIYVIYRMSTGKSLLKRVTVAPEVLKEAEDIAFGNILVPIFGTELDDDIMGTAGRLAAEEPSVGKGVVIEALYPLVVPISLPLDAKLPDQQLLEAEHALTRAKEVGEEYEGVRVATALIRTRYGGAAIVEEAKRRSVEVIVVGGREPSPVTGGSLLGGVSGRSTPYVGSATEYILRKAPCEVILTVPPANAVKPGAMPPAASNGPS